MLPDSGGQHGPIWPGSERHQQAREREGVLIVLFMLVGKC